MPKLKSKSGAKKRFQLTSHGNIKRKHAFKNHILTKKTPKRKKRLTHFAIVDRSDFKNVKRQLLP
jgi:large subunit ribosomal protein L35